MALAPWTYVPRADRKDPIPRDGKGRPRILLPDGSGDSRSYSRVTSYIDVIWDKRQLHDWEKRQVLIGAAGLGPKWDKYADRITAAKDDPRALNRISDELAELSGANAKRNQGTWLHKLSEFADLGHPLPSDASEEDRKDIAAYLVATASMRTILVEQFVVLDDIRVGGTPDRVLHLGPDFATPDKTVPGYVIEDLKTGRIDAFTAAKIRAQLAAYSRGKVYDPATGRRRTWPYEINQKWGLVTHLEPGTARVSFYWADLEMGWSDVQLAGVIRKARRDGAKALVPYVDVSALTIAGSTGGEEDDDGDDD